MVKKEKKNKEQEGRKKSKKKRELVLRWIAPTFVGTKDEDEELPVVIHKLN